MKRSTHFLRPYSLAAIAISLSPVVLPTSLNGQTARTWNGNTDGNLATPANWNGLPLSGDSWVFQAAGSSGTGLVNNLATSSAFDVSGITFGSGASAYTITGGAFSLTGNIVNTGGAGNQNIGSNITITGSRGIQLNVGGTAAGNITLSGNLLGSGTLTQTAGAGAARTVSFSGDNSGFTGSFVQNNDANNRTSFNTATAGSASAAWTLNRNINGGTAISFTGATLHLGSLSGIGFVRANNAGTVTVSVGALNTNTTFSGKFQQANATTLLSLNKVGTGTLTLSGPNEHTASTIIDNGTLNLTGTLPNSDFIVNTAGTLQVGPSKVLRSLTVNGAGTVKFDGSETITNNAALTGAGANLNLVNSTIDTVMIGGAAGLALGGSTATDTPVITLDVGATADQISVANGLVVDAGGASIQINNLGISAGQSYPLITFSGGSGAGYATGTGTTVGALTLANPNLSFGVTGALEVTATGVNLVTSGATPPAAAYWSGIHGSAWNSTSGSDANFTTTPAGSSFLNVLPGANTHVYFSNNSATNLTNTLGDNFSILGLTYRGTAGAVSTSGTNSLGIGIDGITVENGNGGATLAVSQITLTGDQAWTNDSTNPLVVAASSIQGPSTWLTLGGTGAIHLGGTSMSVYALDLLTDLDVKGTAISAALGNSSSNITNTGTANSTISTGIFSDAELSGVISDNGPGAAISIAKSGAASLTLSGANTYSGGSNVSNGTLRAGNNSAFGTGPVNITAATGILDLNGRTIANAINNNGATGSIITNSSATTATVSSGMNAAGAAGYVISDFTFNGTGDIRWDGALNRNVTNGTITKSGSNTLIFNNDNGTSVIAGLNLQINDGTVVLGKAATTFTNLTLNGGTLRMDPNYQVTATFGIWQGTFGNVVDMNGGVWDLNDTGGINNRIKRINGAGGTITNSGTGASLLVLAARDVATVPTASWSGNIQDGSNGGTVALTIQDGGSINQVMIFSGTHTYSGATNIIRNTMRAGAAGVFSPNSEFILSNHVESTLDLNGFNNAIGGLSGGNAASKVLLGSGSLTVGALGTGSTFNGIISGTGGITKVGTGTFSLTGENTYLGDTIVNDGVLGLDGNAIPDTNKLVINGGGIVELTGNEIVATLEIEGNPMGNGTYGATGSGAANIDDTRFSGTGILTVGTGYTAWAAANAGGQTADLDFDLDGVANGIEYFMNAPAGFTANPGVVSGSVTWANGGNIPSSAYGTEFVVQTSPNLGTWTTITAVDPNLSNTTGSVSYTLPTGAGKLFVRLVVMPN